MTMVGPSRRVQSHLLLIISVAGMLYFRLTCLLSIFQLQLLNWRRFGSFFLSLRFDSNGTKKEAGSSIWAVEGVLVTDDISQNALSVYYICTCILVA